MPRTPPRAPSIRFSVEPGDVPDHKIARRLHLTLAQFEAVKVRLFVRGFPRPDETTGMYDLEAVDRWRHRRHPSLFPELMPPEPATPAAPERDMGALAREAYEQELAERRQRRRRKAEA